MRRTLATVAAAAILATACSHATTGAPTPGGTADTGSPVTVSQYGAAPQPNPAVTFQPDVVLVAGGGSAVRGVTNGGFTWLLDPNAAGAHDLAAGKIMFVTGRGVGRVVDVRSQGSDLAVTIVPADITEVIRDGHFSSAEPVSLANPATYDAGTPFWAPGSSGSGEPSATPSPGHSLAQLGEPTLPAPKRGGSVDTTVDDVKVSASCCTGGASVTFNYFRAQFKATGTVTLTMDKPAAVFDLQIAGGKIKLAKLEVTGGFGIKVDFAGATEIFANLKRDIAVPVDFSIPFANLLGVPLSATVNQEITVATDFHAKDGNIKANGEWGIGGGLGFTYRSGFWSFDAPHSLQTKRSLTDSIQGISIGVNRFSVGYDVKVTVGIGAFGFTAGPYFGLHVTATVARGSAAGGPIAVCNSATVDIYAKYGVGWTIPSPVAKLVNFFLRKFGTKPIKTNGGIGRNSRTFSATAYDPNTKICTG